MPQEPIQTGQQTDSTPGTAPEVEAFPLGPFQTNCYLVYEPETRLAWIVDPGFDPAVMLRRVAELALRVQAIVLTHAHADHIGGVSEVRGTLAITDEGEPPVWLHTDEAKWLNDPELNLSNALGFPVTCHGPDRTIAEGDTLELGDLNFDVLHTPGHSPGSVSLVCRGHGFVLAGDTLFDGSIGRHDFPTSDSDALFASIRKKLYALPDETLVLPGHGPTTTIGKEKRSNPFVQPL